MVNDTHSVAYAAELLGIKAPTLYAAIRKEPMASLAMVGSRLAADYVQELVPIVELERRYSVTGKITLTNCLQLYSRVYEYARCSSRSRKRVIHGEIRKLVDDGRAMSFKSFMEVMSPYRTHAAIREWTRALPLYRLPSSESFMTTRTCQHILWLFESCFSSFEASQTIGINIKTITAWVCTGKIKAYIDPTGRYRFTQSEVDTLRAERIERVERINYKSIAKDIGIPRQTLYNRVRSGAEGKRPPEVWVEQLKKERHLLNPGFEWLQPNIPTYRYEVMSGTRARRLLNTTSATFDRMVQAGLVPFYVQTVVAQTAQRVHREYVAKYIEGLGQFATAYPHEMGIRIARDYFALCKDQQKIV